MGVGLPSSGVKQERHVVAPITPHARRHLQDCMVRGASYSEAMRPTDGGPLGGEGKTVEADETYVGGKAKNRAYAKTLPSHEAVMSLVERGGKVRSHHVADVTAKTIKPILVDAILRIRTSERIKVLSIRKSARALRAMLRSIIGSKSTFAVTLTPIQSRAISRSSSAASMAFITTSANNI